MIYKASLDAHRNSPLSKRVETGVRESLVALALVLFAASPRIIHKWSVGLTIFVKRFLAEAAWVASKRVF
jgi:hypothetical protein